MNNIAALTACFAVFLLTAYCLTQSQNQKDLASGGIPSNSGEIAVKSSPIFTTHRLFLFFTAYPKPSRAVNNIAALTASFCFLPLIQIHHER